jgi:hypothetical protein
MYYSIESSQSLKAKNFLQVENPNEFLAVKISKIGLNMSEIWMSKDH